MPGRLQYYLKGSEQQGNYRISGDRGNFTQTPLRKQQITDYREFEQIFSSYLQQKGGEIKNSTEQDMEWDIVYTYKDSTVYFDLKFYSSNFSMRENLCKASERLSKGKKKVTVSIVLAVANRTAKPEPYIFDEIERRAEDESLKEKLLKIKPGTEQWQQYEKALRRVAIIISRKGADENVLAAVRGSLRESGKLILCLSDRDILEMMEIKERNERPTEAFLGAMLDDLLIHLEK